MELQMVLLFQQQHTLDQKSQVSMKGLHCTRDKKWAGLF